MYKEQIYLQKVSAVLKFRWGEMIREKKKMCIERVHRRP